MIKANRDFNVFEITCDRCPSGTEEVDCDFGWGTMIEEIKDKGWKVFKADDGVWTHTCPACAAFQSIENSIKDFTNEHRQPRS